LIQNKIIAPAEGTVEVQLGPGGIVAGIKYTAGGLAWIPHLTRLEVQALSDEADPGSFVAGIFELLKHTPMRAVGHNFVFEPDEATGTALVRRHAPALPAAIGGLVGDQVKLGIDMSIKLPHGSSVLSITIQATPERLTQVRMHFLREMVDALEAAEAARAWRSDRDEAFRLMRQIEDLGT